MNKKVLLAVRKAAKKKRPAFKRTDSHKLARLGTEWRRARGRHSKIRLRRKGSRPQPGYGAPKAVRGLHSSGLRDIIVNNISELSKLDAKEDAARIAAGVGLKKRVEIIKEAEKLGIRVLNPGLKALAALAPKKEEKKKTEKKEAKAAEKKTGKKKEVKEQPARKQAKKTAAKKAAKKKVTKK